MKIILLLLLSAVVWCADPPVNIGLGPAPVTSASPSGNAGGDLTGTYPNPTVAGISAGTAPIITTSTLSIGSAAQFTVSAAGATVAPSVATPIISTTANLTVTDATNTWNPVVYSAGAVGAGYITYAGTLDASDTTHAANVMSGGLALTKSIRTGGQIICGGALQTAGNLTVSVAGNAELLINASTGNIPIQLFQINGTSTVEFAGTNSSGNWVIQDKINSYNPISYNAGASSAGTIVFGATTASTSVSTGAVTISGGLGVGGEESIASGNLNITTSTANGSVASVFTASQGPTGAATAIQGWITIKVAGTNHYIPYW